MLNLSDINTIKSLLGRHGFTFSKSMGQNFLIDPTVCPRMAESCGIDRDSAVIEIGTGVGVLTQELSVRAAKVAGVELDGRLLPVLAETLKDCRNVEIINQDVLKTDLHALIAEKFEGRKTYVCANLPYYITSPVLMYLLENRLPIEAVTVMVQKEAADRLCAPVGSRDSGAITAAVNYYAAAKRLFDVPRTAFLPAPNVDSAVLRLDLRKEPPVEVPSEEFFFKVVRAAFSMRRKTAQNGLSNGLGISRQTAAEALDRAGLSPTVRAESLSLEQLANMTRELYGG